MTIQELNAYLKAHPETKYIDGVLFDMCGFALGKRYPIRDAAKLYEDGLTMCAAVTLLDATGNTSDPKGFGVSDGDPDALAFPIAGTLTPVPWAAEPTAQVLMSMRRPQSGEIVPFEPRQVLKRVADRFDDLKITPVVALELEFYLIDLDRGSQGGPLPVRSPATGRRMDSKKVYSMDTLDEFSEVLGAITDACAIQGIPASVASTEFAPGQFELNLNHVTDPLQAADHACLLRRCVKSVARQHGMDATFLSKPFAEESGSGLHVHISFLGEDGGNIFDESIDSNEERMRHAMAGLQATMGQSMAFFAPNLNAFRRFEPNLFVPVTTDWGYDNRSLAFRIPSARGQAKRIEHRVAGADANPYLALACVLAGLHHGLSNRLEPTTPPRDGNAGEEADPALPLTIWRALDALSGATILQEYLGSDYVDIYHTVKSNEFLDLLSEPLPREMQWYL
ncbi:MAG: glutamine synthetase family protein [Alphaproteobacteria bacterium]|nr:glutamine synthetase family protein [Alphaproteobacteria bacterium]